MPLGFERINERQQRPNALINFIRPLEGPDKATAEEFLSRIAAQCYPVMKKHHIGVMALEEYAPNPEFLGRNFNAGEVIQLVLKDKQGRWLSLKFVQMVMMHELAHCKQMNHSRFFWNVRNEYAKHMEELWREKYSGEGIWGRGRGLRTGAFVNAAPPDNSQIPEHLCGGSYRRRGRKRKRGQQDTGSEKLTYAERQQRRIARKFGKHGGGESLGDDELFRGALETMNGGKRGQGKPRVANSKRGRELRAAAALARFGQAKSHTSDLEDDSGTESGWDEGSYTGDRQTTVIDDGHGRELIKVCGGGEENEEGAGKELEELRMLSAAPQGRISDTKRPVRGEDSLENPETESEHETPLATTAAVYFPREPSMQPTRAQSIARRAQKQEDDGSKADEDPSSSHEKKDAITDAPTNQAELLWETGAQHSSTESSRNVSKPTPAIDAPLTCNNNATACVICSLENQPDALICTACSNVLRPKLMKNHWRCKSATCELSEYINVGDVGRCGICGAQRPKMSTPSESVHGRHIGITGPEVLRWE